MENRGDQRSRLHEKYDLSKSQSEMNIIEEIDISYCCFFLKHDHTLTTTTHHLIQL